MLSRPEFLTALTSAIQTTEAELFDTPNTFPRAGIHGRLRFRVTPTATRVAEGVLDPMGLVWYARTGDYRSLLQASWAGFALGLSDDDVHACLAASDAQYQPRGSRAWRAELTTTILAAFSLPEAPKGVGG